VGRQGKKQEKHFFFEKKKQKTFDPKGAPIPKTRAKSQKFFASFFQKRRLFLPTS
jgi:hypothetical protein